MRDAKYLAWLGISLTAFMGAAVFLLVLINPKSESYSLLPLAYSLACVALGGIANFFARQNEDPEPVPIPVSRREL